MTDREKVIRALENCNARKKCKDCPWEPCEEFDCKHSDYPDGLIQQALALLKAQEPRLITNADFENTDMVDSAESLPAWIEYRRGEEWDEYTDGNEDGWSIVYQFNFESEFYLCWTSRPTDAQREAVKWE